ncbi:MAG: AhpC/TSA family protein [Alphaproteobacteria bacterium]|nr:AhpC/TSA family protein [Alphaproteobacteria bacterium]
MLLKQTLLELGRHHRAALSVRDRADFEDELNRLRMMRLAEEGLGLGDLLPDFALEDVAGRFWTSGELLDRGPLVLALFRGDWCPYCDLTMAALEKARPAIEALGATAVGILPDGREHIARTAARRGIGYLLLSDPANAYSRTCGLAYDLSPDHIRLHRERGRDLPTRHGDSTWRLPVPAVFVVEPNARVAFAFADVDPERWPDPEALLASLQELYDLPASSNR